MLNWYQHLPEYVNPIIFHIGHLAVRWYAVMYLVAFWVVYKLLIYRILKGEHRFIISKQVSHLDDRKDVKRCHLKSIVTALAGSRLGGKNLALEVRHFKKLVFDFLIYSFIGLIIGARLGYVFFYNFNYFFHNPLAIISPFSPDGNFTGIFGMSYFGGLVGVIIASLIFIKIIKNYRIDFWQWADFVVPAIPAGYFFGRIGNFLNGELYGRVTDSWIGMYFPRASLMTPLQLRHPSQLYEAFFEGLILFIILWILRNRSRFPVQLLLIYLFGYGFFRFFIEFFREPDPQIGLIWGFLTLGQIFCLSLIIIVTVTYLTSKKPKIYPAPQKTTGVN